MSTKNALAGVAYFNKQLNEDIYLYDQKMNKNDPLGTFEYSFS